MAVLMSRRLYALASVLLTGVAVVALAAPAGAQVAGAAQATPLVGVSGTAACPAGGAPTQVVGQFSAGGFTIGFPAAGSCQDTAAAAANTQGSYTIGGAGPLPFSSGCQSAGLQNGGSVDVPIGTIINPGTPGQRTTTTVETITGTTAVIFPNGTPATLNVVSTTATTVTRTAIVSGGASIGRVICGAANVYPLSVDAASGSGPAAVGSPLSAAANNSSGPGHSLLLLAVAGFGAIVLGQVVISRKLRNEGNTGS